MKETMTKFLLGGIAVLLFALVLRVSFPAAQAQGTAPSAPAPSLPGRYQLVRVSDHAVFLTDTQTGQTWSRSWSGDFATGDWISDTPVALEKKP